MYKLGNKYLSDFTNKNVQSIFNIYDVNLIYFQVVADGYEFFVKKKLVTIFSAPNYLGKVDNDGAIVSVDGSLKCTIQVLEASKNQKLGSSQHKKTCNSASQGM